MNKTGTFREGFRRGIVIAWLIGGPLLIATAFAFAVRGIAEAWVCVTMAFVGAVGFMLADVLTTFAPHEAPTEKHPKESR